MHYQAYSSEKENGTRITCESSLCRVIHAINLKISAALGPRTPRRRAGKKVAEIRARGVLGDVQRSNRNRSCNRANRYYTRKVIES